MFYRVWFGSRFEYPSDTLCANDRSGAGDLCDDHEFDIGIGYELIHSMSSGSRLCRVPNGAHTREEMIVRREFHIPNFLRFVCVLLGSV